MHAHSQISPLLIAPARTGPAEPGTRQPAAATAAGSAGARGRSRARQLTIKHVWKDIQGRASKEYCPLRLPSRALQQVRMIDPLLLDGRQVRLKETLPRPVASGAAKGRLRTCLPHGARRPGRSISPRSQALSSLAAPGREAPNQPLPCRSSPALSGAAEASQSACNCNQA